MDGRMGQQSEGVTSRVGGGESRCKGLWRRGSPLPTRRVNATRPTPASPPPTAKRPAPQPTGRPTARPPQVHVFEVVIRVLGGLLSGHLLLLRQPALVPEYAGALKT